MTTIGGKLDLAALAQLHRPADEDALRAAAYELRQRGLTDRDIGVTLQLSEFAVEQLLNTRDDTGTAGA